MNGTEDKMTIQKRLAPFLTIYYTPIILIAVALLLLLPEMARVFFNVDPEHIGILKFLDFELKDKIIILLTVAITLYAQIEARSFHHQVTLEEKRFQIEDVRRELEKAYGPLYTMFTKYDNTVLLTAFEKTEMNIILANYPFMFSEKVYSFWKEKLRYEHLGDMMEFREMMKTEYNLRVKKYNELIKKS